MADGSIAPLKVCTICGSALRATAEHFHRSPGSRSGLRSACKRCWSIKRKQERIENGDGLREKAAARRANESAEDKERRRQKDRERQRSKWIADPDEMRRRQRERRSSPDVVERNRERTKRWRDALTPEEQADRRAEARLYYAENAERVKVRILEQARSEGGKARLRAYHQVKWKSDPRHRIRVCVSSQIRHSLKGTKALKSWESLVGYSVEDLRAHLERQFCRGMTWENYGSCWHIDHIVPVSAFSFTSADDEAFKACWQLSNLRPLWAVENLKKGARRSTLL